MEFRRDWLDIIQFIVSILTLLAVSAYTVLTYKLMRASFKQLDLMIQRPEIEIGLISLTPQKDNGQGGKIGNGYYIEISIINPASLGNFFKIGIMKGQSILNIISLYSDLISAEFTEFEALAPFQQKKIIVPLNSKSAQAHENEKLTLLLIDIRKQEVRREFMLEQSFL